MDVLKCVVIFSFLTTAYSYRNIYDVNNVHQFEIGHDKAAPSQVPRAPKANFTNCNTTAVPIYVQNLTMTNPVILGKFLIIDTTWDILKTISGKIEYDLDILLLVGRDFRSLCDLLDPEICHGDDLCQKLSTISLAKTCIPPLTAQGFNCQCPFKRNTIRLKLPLPLPKVQFDIYGEFMFKLQLRQGKSELMCFELVFCIKDCDV